MEIVGLFTVKKEVRMRNLTRLAMAAFSMISSFLIAQQSTDSFSTLIADALKYFSPHERIDLAKQTNEYVAIAKNP